jgi:hypothetical protein
MIPERTRRKRKLKVQELPDFASEVSDTDLYDENDSRMIPEEER